MTNMVPDMERPVVGKTDQVPAQTKLESGEDGKQPNTHL